MGFSSHSVTNPSEGTYVSHHIRFSPSDSSTEPQTHNWLSVGSSMAIMLSSLLLNTLLRHLLHSQLLPLYFTDLLLHAMPNAVVSCSAKKTSQGLNKSRLVP